MLHFLQNFVYYLTLEVIGPNAHEMQTGLAEARDMDQVRHCVYMCMCVYVYIYMYVHVCVYVCV